MYLNFRDVDVLCIVCGSKIQTQARNRKYCDKCKPQAVAKIQQAAYDRLIERRRQARNFPSIKENKPCL